MIGLIRRVCTTKMLVLVDVLKFQFTMTDAYYLLTYSLHCAPAQLKIVAIMPPKNINQEQILFVNNLIKDS